LVVVDVDEDATCVMPALVAAITVPNMMNAESMAAKMNPAVFMDLPSVKRIRRDGMRVT
jgi:hypothetical protein